MKNQAILEALEVHNISKSFFKLSEKIEEKLEEEKYKDADYYYQKMQLHHQRYIYPNQLKLNVEQDYLLEAMNNLELYYIASSIQYYIELYTRRNVFKTEIPPYLSLENLLKRLEQPPFDQMVLFQIKRRMLELLIQKDDTTYQQLKLLVIENINKISHKEQYLIINTLLNYTIDTSRTGEIYYLIERFEIYQFALQYGLLIENNYLNPLHFLNVVDTALVTGKYDWVSNFIKTEQELIHQDFRKNTILLAKAQFEFAKSNFQETIFLLKDVEFKSLSYLVIGKGRLLQSYFELVKSNSGNYDLSLESLIRSYKTQLTRRSKESTKLCEANINFVEFVRILYKELNFPKTSSSELNQVLESLHPIAYKVWLAKKIEEISKH